ncbi:MAG TPA: pyridoxal-phosphate dependent enzyme [Polyangiales bacterium]|nr:pyridoxal-phosphate dependent enzyme [Polyangiales bacterium]
MAGWPDKLRLAHLPTPLQRAAALDALVGCELWIKRDDMTGGAEAGNKIRKLEYLLAAARAQGADSVITCGGVQSNHARATAILARQLGLRPVLVLRTADGRAPALPWQGNLMLGGLLGAELHFITPAQYRERDRLLADLAAELRRGGRVPYVIPEGGSCGLGALGYVDAMAEVRGQLDGGVRERGEPAPPSRFDAVVHACGSGGTAAGICIGAALHDVADQAVAVAVCDDGAYFSERVRSIHAEIETFLPELVRSQVPLRILDDYKGPAYGVASPEQSAFIAEVARVSGLILDPVYSGKALFGLARLAPKAARVLFVHTGGLPGLLAEPEQFASQMTLPTFPTLRSS